MAPKPRPTRTPIFAAQHDKRHGPNYFPPPQHPAADTAHNKSTPLLKSSASQPNLYDSPSEYVLDHDGTVAKKKVYKRSKSCFRWLVLCLSCWAMFGSYYCYDNPTALATQMQSTYDLTDIQYNLLYSVYSFPNIVLPLFGGALVDKIGAEISLLIFLVFVTVGQAVFAFATSINSYPLMLVGRVVFGFGGESLCVAESALLAVYFVGTEVAFAMGLNLSIGRAGSSLNDWATLRIYELNESVPEALWAGFLLLCVCLAFTVIMLVLDRYKARQKEKKGYFVPQAHSGEVVQLADIREFNMFYWLITVSCIVVYGCVLPWNNIGGAFMQSQYGFSASKANHYLMIPYLSSAFCVPFFGYLCDRIGRRAELLVVSTIALGITHAMFAWFTEVDPVYALGLMGVAYSIYASAIWPSVSLVVKESKLGTAYGFITSLQNGGLALFPVIVGQLTGPKDEPTTRYYYVEIFFFALAAFGVVVGAILWTLDYRGDRKLAKPSIRKGDDDDEEEEENCVNKDDNDLSELRIEKQNSQQQLLQKEVNLVNTDYEGVLN
mmetsp:Transcript_59956/g.98969  ORF Transcript_59956/g.98969 Transcript_59956/m.98969 type:complete len:550 (+) Transcript_59956:21-1670(+)